MEDTSTRRPPRARAFIAGTTARAAQTQPVQEEELRFKAGDAVSARYAGDGENYNATIARVYRASGR